jgi:orotate phosphoribosyltransferase
VPGAHRFETEDPAARLERQLLDLLVRLSYFREPGKSFTLASGRVSDYYIECSLTTTNFAALPLIGALVHARVPESAVAIGGPTMGADPIAAAVAFHSAGTARPVSWFSVRKTPKEHGARRWLEGSARPGDRVVVVEDVITSGGSLLEAVRKCGEEGLEVRRAVVLVDREEDGGRARVEQALGRLGADFQALFTRTALEAAWRAARG